MFHTNTPAAPCFYSKTTSIPKRKPCKREYANNLVKENIAAFGNGRLR